MSEPTTNYREFVDFHGLSHFWDKAKGYLHTQVTARRNGSGFVLDRTYQELVMFIEKDAPVYPLLRVVDGSSIEQYQLDSFTDGVFTFKGFPKFIADSETSMLTGICTKEFTYGPDGFAENFQNIQAGSSAGTLVISARKNGDVYVPNHNFIEAHETLDMGYTLSLRIADDDGNWVYYEVCDYVFDEGEPAKIVFRTLSEGEESFEEDGLPVTTVYTTRAIYTPGQLTVERESKYDTAII